MLDIPHMNGQLVVGSAVLRTVGMSPSLKGAGTSVKDFGRIGTGEIGGEGNVEG